MKLAETAQSGPILMTGDNRTIRDLSRRGLAAVDSEWKLICATHNLLKVYRRT